MTAAVRLAVTLAAVVVVLGLSGGLAAGQPAPSDRPDRIEKVGEPVQVRPIAKPPFRGQAGAPKGALTGADARAALERAAAEAPAAHGAQDGLKNSRLAALLFWFFAVCTVGGAIFVITRKNPITAVMGLVGTFFALAGLFLMLYASFLAAIQVLVYAGAIMVLFVFVIMMLNRPEEEPWALSGLLGKALAGLAIAYVTWRLGGVLWDLKDTQHAVVAGPRPVYAIAPGDPGDFGSVRAVGNTLFRDYLFPFEAVSLVLLAAVVGAIAVARPHEKDHAQDPVTPATPPAPKAQH